MRYALLAGLALVGATRVVVAQEEPIVTTQHQITIGGKVLRYTARAGRIPIRDNDAGEIHGQMFFVAYSVPRRPGEPPRPLTFAWNGGPGSNAGLVHLLGFGPRRIRSVASKSGLPTESSIIEDNPGTWLDHTDLVFVDPIGTGYSRPTKPEYAAEFYQTRGDAESVAEFIRVYRNRYEMWDSPLFLAGESYGVTRAAGVAEALSRRGVQLKGATLIGLSIPLGQLPANMRTALIVPAWTAAAFYHKKLPAELQSDLQKTLRAAEAFAETELGPALANRESLSDAQRASLVAQIARFSGLDPQFLDPATLSLSANQIDGQLLRREGRFVGRYDTRLTGKLDTTVQQYDPTTDPSLKDLLSGVAVLRYMQSELNYTNDLLYQGPFGGGYPAPTTFRGDWMSTRWNRGGGLNPGGGRGDSTAGRGGAGRGRGADAAAQPLRTAMLASPDMKVLVVCGYYDLICPYHANEWVVEHLDPELKGRVTARSYGGGHAVYTDPEAQLQLRRDVARLIQGTLPPGSR